MKNRMRLPMLMASSFLLCFMFLTSCSKDDGPSKKEEESKSLVLTLSRLEIKERETVQFTVTAEGMAVDNATIYIDGAAITGDEHTFDQPGSFKVVAKKTGYLDSDQQGVVVLARQMQTVVHIVGTETNSNGAYVAKYWKNGTPTILGNGALATSLVLVNNDVHISGVNESNSQLIYWKNGTEVRRIDNAATILGKSIAVSGDDVYLSGYQDYGQGAWAATYWKNGQATVLSDNPKGSLASSIFVSGDGVYVGGAEADEQGNEVMAVHWKNGETTQLNHFKGFGEMYPTLVLGEDIYFAGMVTNAAGVNATIGWKNDQEILSIINDLGDILINSFFISGMDVYVGGSETVNDKTVAKYWKNGQGVTLTDGSTDAMVLALYVLKEEVYAVGFEMNENGVEVAKCWKNGEAMDLTDGNNAALVYDIIVEEIEIE